MKSIMPRTAHNLLIYGVLGILSAALAGCGDLGQFNRYRRDFHMEQAFQQSGRLEVENFNGSVDIASWPRNSLEVSGTKSGPSEAELDKLKIDVHVDGGVAYVHVDRPPGNWNGGYSTQLHIRVPKATNISRVKTTNGGVSVEDVDGGGDVSSTNGRILLARDTGSYHVETTNGGVEIDECQGAFHLRTTNGAVRGTLRGSVDAGTSNGGVDLTLRHVQSGEPLRATTRNGSVVLSLGELNGNAVTSETTNGGITLRLPDSSNGELNAETSTGSVKSDLPLTVSQSSKHSLSGKLGSGGPPIQLHTSTGSIHIQRF